MKCSKENFNNLKPNQKYQSCLSLRRLLVEFGSSLTCLLYTPPHPPHPPFPPPPSHSMCTKQSSTILFFIKQTPEQLFWVQSNPLSTVTPIRWPVIMVLRGGGRGAFVLFLPPVNGQRLLSGRCGWVAN